MKLLGRIGLVLVALVVVGAVVGFLLPRRVHIERSTRIASTRSTVFTLLNSYRRFNEWSPWAALDPATKYTYSGPPSGVGAKMAWVGDAKTVGTGSQQIVANVPDESVTQRYQFDASVADARFVLADEGDATRVTWHFETDLGWNPFARYFGPLIVRQVAPDFEKGLAGLKRLAERLPRADLGGLTVEVTEVKSVPLAYVEATSGISEQEEAAAIGGALAQVRLFLVNNNLQAAGPARTINRNWGGATRAFDAAVPIDRLPLEPVPAESVVKVKGSYAGQVAKAVHKGPYSGIPATADRLLSWVAINGYTPDGDPWSEFVTEPGSVPSAELTTNIYVPVR